MKQKKPSAILNTLLPLTGLWVPFLSIFYAYLYFDYFGKRALAACFLFLLIVFFFQTLIQKKSLYFSLIFITSLFFSLFSFIEIAHLTIFNGRISASTIHILLETNWSESVEFLSRYLRPSLLILSLIHLISILIGLIFSHRWTANTGFNKRLMITSGLLSVIFFVYLRNSYLPIIAARSYLAYQKERKILNELSIKKIGDFENVKHTGNGQSEIYVLIIGESTTRSHMGLYGYYRETNPLLSKKRDELVIYSNVRSSHTNTIQSLGRALTVHNGASPVKKYNSTLIQLFNNANFETHFISNQKPIGLYETTTRLLTKTSDKSIFTDVSDNMLDEAVIEPLQKALKESSKKKFIVVHLMGTHGVYAKRYPPKFRTFIKKPVTKFNHEVAYKTINEYDNAVLYNDYIVNCIIDEVKKQDSKSYVVYFSDHGEDVFESINEANHADKRGTEPMYNIPFIIWLSDKYKSNMSDLDWDTERHYTTGSLIHTIADLSNIKFRRFDPTKSLVNSKFQDFKKKPKLKGQL